MSENKSFRPSKSEILHLSQDRTFKWCLAQVKHQFPAWPAHLPPNSLEEAHSRAAEQAVIRAFEKLLES